jgi:Gpi18-like mannosyltransferase
VLRKHLCCGSVAVERHRRMVAPDVLVFAGCQVVVLSIVLIALARHVDSVTALSFHFRRWDASWYLSIAHHGYDQVGPRAPAIVFFPLYPALIRLTMFIVHKDVVAALVVAASASIVGHVAFYRSLKSRPELSESARNSLLLLLVWPSAIFFSLLYTESLYLMCTAGFLYYLFKERIGLAAVAAAFAALARLPGVFCLVPLALWILTDPSRPAKKRILRLAWCAVAASGFLLVLIVNKVGYDDWFAFLGYEKSHWRKSIVPLWTSIGTALGFLWSPSWYFGWPDVADHYFVLATGLLLVLWVIMCRRSFTRSRWTLFAWAAVQWFVIASSGSPVVGVSWISSTRYLMLVLPLYVAVCDLAGNRRSIIYPLSAASAVLALLMLGRWSAGHWAE